MSLRKTEELVEAAARELGLGLTVHHTDVRRYEGGDEDRRPNPPIGYVRAFAVAFGVDPDHLLAVDVPEWSLGDLRRDWDSLQARWEAQLRRSPRTAAERERDQLRDRVALALHRASGLPHSPNDNPWEQLPWDTLARIQDDLERLFWEAFQGRGLTDEQLLQRAVELGKSLPSPPRLPAEGFLRYSEIPEGALHRWWIHTAASLRELIRENEAYTPEIMNLGRYGEGGYPIPWGEWIEGWDAIRELSKEEILESVRDIPSDETLRVPRPSPRHQPSVHLVEPEDSDETTRAGAPSRECHEDDRDRLPNPQHSE